MDEDKLKKSFRLASLINRYKHDELKEAQIKELFDWVESNKENRKLFKELLSEPYIKLAIQKLNPTDTEFALVRIQEKMTSILNEKLPGSSKLKTVSHFTI